MFFNINLYNRLKAGCSFYIYPRLLFLEESITWLYYAKKLLN